MDNAADLCCRGLANLLKVEPQTNILEFLSRLGSTGQWATSTKTVAGAGNEVYRNENCCSHDRVFSIYTQPVLVADPLAHGIGLSEEV